jgi:hypothetical protein
MNITKYGAMFSMAILLTGAFAVTFSLFIANVEALEENNFKKYKVKKFKCNNINVNINGEEIIHTENNGPFCINNNNNNNNRS